MSTRTVFKPIVDVTNVKIKSGLDYINWICVARRKLKEREMSLLQKRLQICENIINNSIHQFTNENMKAFAKPKLKVLIKVKRMQTENFNAFNKMQHESINNIKNNCNQLITQQLSNWKGYQPKSKSKFNTFAEYFKECRRWWDVAKMKMIGKHFVVPVSEIINEFTQKAASEFFCNRFFNMQKLYQTYLTELVLINLFEGMIKIPNTRPLYLVPAQTYSSFTIKNSKVVYNASKVRKGKTKTIRNETLKLLKEEYNNNKLQFESELLSLHYEVDNYTIDENMTRNVNNLNYSHSTQMVNMYSENPSAYVHANYTNYHGVENKTQAIRYRPF
eukprot:46845_1